MVSAAVVRPSTSLGASLSLSKGRSSQLAAPKREARRRVRNPWSVIRAVVLIAAVLTVAVGSARVSAQGMPDVSQMSGVPLPVGDLAPGTVTVRVIRGSLANPIGSHPVELISPGGRQTANTNEAGRAEFSDLRPGMRVRARTTVDGQTLESQEFEVPTSGGIRLMLVAVGAAAAGAADPNRLAPESPRAQPGVVSLGEQSRFVFEIGDDGLSVFNIFQIVNEGAAPVQPASPVVFDLPQDARGATVMQGSSPQASVSGRRLEVKGPFAPGATAVQVAYTMPYSGPDLTIEQPLPLPLAGVMVIAQKVGTVEVRSRQLAQQREMPADGQTYIVGRGPAMKAGETVTFNFTGLPHHATWPRNLALAVAVAILAGGAWTSMNRGGIGLSETSRRKKLEGRRDRLFNELTALEVQHREQAVDAGGYAERRRELVTALERIYAELDDEGVGVSRAS